MEWFNDQSSTKAKDERVPIRITLARTGRREKSSIRHFKVFCRGHCLVYFLEQANFRVGYFPPEKVQGTM